MSWPNTFARKTKHKKPRFQLYQPGFNRHNGCWLEGSWVTVPEAEWKKCKAKHEKMCARIVKQAKSQSHHNKGVAIKNMTEEQRQAYEHYSGTGRFDVVYENGAIGGVGVEMAGNRVKPSQEKWLRERGAKLPKWTYARGKKKPAVNQLRGVEVSTDLISTTHGVTKETAVDVWQQVVDQNLANQEGMFDAMLEGATQDDSPYGDDQRGFFAQMAFHSLVRQEESIIRMEWNEERGRKDEFTTLDRERERLVEMRKRALAKCESKDQFEKLMAQARAGHNECARANLDNSDGRLFSYVLPKFNDDGTHEPVGERDVPWNAHDPWTGEKL